MNNITPLFRFSRIIICLYLLIGISKITATETINQAPRDVFLTLISTDYTTKTYTLFVQVDKDNIITSVKIRNNKKNKMKTYSNSKLNTKMTLVKALGVSIITLSCANFNPSNGCVIGIEYPSNLMFGKYKSFHALLKKTNNKWGLWAGATNFTNMHLKSLKVIGLLVGIKKIELY